MKKLHDIIEQIHQIYKLQGQSCVPDIPSYYPRSEEEFDEYHSESIDLSGIAHLLEQASEEFKDDQSVQFQIEALVKSLKEKEADIITETKEISAYRKGLSDECATLISEGHNLIEKLDRDEKDRVSFTSIRTKHFNSQEFSVLQDSLKDIGIVFLQESGRFMFMKTKENESKSSLSLLIEKIEDHDEMGESISKKLKNKAQSSTISLHVKESVALYCQTFVI